MRTTARGISEQLRNLERWCDAASTYAQELAPHSHLGMSIFGVSLVCIALRSAWAEPTITVITEPMITERGVQQLAALVQRMVDQAEAFSAWERLRMAAGGVQ